MRISYFKLLRTPRCFLTEGNYDYMNRISTIIASLCAIMACAQDSIPRTAEQQRIEDLKHSQKVVMLPGEGEQAPNDSVRRTIERFYIDQYRHFQDPEAPYFLMMSRDATLAMGIGGAVRMRGWYDFDGAMPYNGFIPFTIAVPENPARRRALKATPAGSALYFRIIGTNKALGNFSAFIQGNFDGGGSDFKIKKSYVTINDWTIGYAPSAFCDIAANPPVIDAQGPCGQTNNTSVLLQWAHSLRRGWSVAASVEFPASHILADGELTQEIDDWMPDVVAYGQYQWARGAGHVRLSGLLRVLPYRDLVAQKNRSLVGFGVQGSAVVPVGYALTLYGEAVGGRGCATYINDLMVTTLDLINDAADPGKMTAPWCMGFTAGVKYNFRPNLFASICASEARYRPGANADPSTYKYGLYGAANVVWNMSPRLQVGAEYLMGKRKNYGGESGDAKRVNLLFSFMF